MEYHEYSLSKRGKSICPECGRKTFVLYISNITGDPLHSTVGKCDRDDNCRWHYTPREYFADNSISFDTKKVFTSTPKPTPKPEPLPLYIDKELLKRSLTGYEINNFVLYLRTIVGDKAASEATSRYFIGTSKKWGGATVFYQIDLHGKIRRGKIMQYGTNGKRVKVNDEARISSVHYELKLPNKPPECLFGEHLISDKFKPVAIVESEKTATIASCYMPNFIWLACGQKQGLSDEKCKVLNGRNVILYPDCKAYGDWVKKADELSKICSVSVSDLIEKYAAKHEYDAGYDLADYLVRFSPSEFIMQPSPQQPTAVIAQNCAVNTEGKTSRVNPVVAAMCAKNPALSRLMTVFDCEVTRTDTYEPQPSRMLKGDELTRLAAGLPDHNSWTETELCRMLNIEPQRVRSMADRKEIYFVQTTGKYCRNGCTPF